MSKKILLTLSLCHYCAHASTIDWMDMTVQPQNNFYLYSNGQWIKNHPIPDDNGRWSMFDVLEKKNQNELVSQIQSIPKNKVLSKSRINQQIFDYYQSGMNIKKIEELKSKPLAHVIYQIQHFHNNKELPHLIAKLHTLGVNVFFEIGPMNDFHQSNQIIAGISQYGLNLPHRDYYLKQDKHSRKIQESYLKFLNILFLELNFSTDMAKKAALQTFEIEKKLALFFMTQEYFRQPKNIDHQMTSEALLALYPNLNLKDYFELRQLPKHFIINNCTPSFLQQLNNYIKTLSPQAIQHYLLAHLMFQYANNMHHTLYQGYCQLNMALSGTKTCPKREDNIIKELNTNLGFAIGDLYVATHLQPGAIEKTEEMIEGIKHELKLHLENSWMSPSTKTQALLKLKNMKSRVGFSRFHIDYQTLSIKPQSYVENAMAIITFETKRQLLKIGRPIDAEEWDMSPQSINAYYDVSQNQINLPLGILQTPFFDVHATDAMNYGGIGAVIGHEISHGFDDQGAQFNEQGQFKSWWTQKDWETYQQKVQCIIQQYSQYAVQGYPKHHLNGKLVSGEAIADLIGLNLAYQAYLHSPPFKRDITIEKFTPMQQFFINYAHIWAANIRNEEALKRSLIDPHPPMNFRVNGTLENMPEFYQTFSIPYPKDNLCSIL